MAQTPSLRRSEGDHIDYTPGSAVAAGDVVVQGRVVAVATSAITASVKGALATKGVFRMPKITGALTAGAPIYWDDDANPVTGDAGSGAITGTQADGVFAGFVELAAASGDATVDVKLAQSQSQA